MKAILITQTPEVRIRFRTMLLDVGFSECRIASNAADADKEQCRSGAQCILFDRALARGDYKAFYRQFTDPSIWFVPISIVRDDYDTISAINSWRAAYWLTEAAAPQDIRKMCDCVLMRIGEEPGVAPA